MLSEEEIMAIAEAAKGWCGKRGSLTQTEPAFAREHPAAWAGMVELGWPGSLIDEEFGGSAIGIPATGRVMVELGRALVTSPLLSTGILASDIIDRCGTADQKACWLPRIVRGERLAVGVAGELNSPLAKEDTLVARRVESGWILSGTKPIVRDGDRAGYLLASAKMQGEGGPRAGLFLVPADKTDRRTGMLADGSGVASYDFRSVSVADDAWLSEGVVERDLPRSLDLARLMLSAEMFGLASIAFETTLNYLKQRRQFGRTIGSFQALQHRAATMFVKLELARSCLEAALDAPEGLASVERIALASYQVKSALNLVTREAIQMHGGIGMTTSHPAGLFLKRARVLEYSLEGSVEDAERYARLRGI